MRRSTCFLAMIALAFIVAACDGDDSDATPSAAMPSATSAIVTTPTPATAPTGVPTDDLPAIVIEAPELGAIVEVPFTISGTANVFEAALSVQVLTADGQLVCQHNIMATSGSGTRGDWTTTMAFPPPEPPAGNAAVPMIVRALSYSARDGSEENVVTVDINVSGQRPPNVITQPTCGAEASAGAMLTVSGVTDAFEGSLQLELQDASGNVALSETVQAEGGLGNAPWETTLSLAGIQPGAYTLIAFDFSAEDGTRQNEFPVPVTIIP
jgi:hypothetical protein